MKVILHPLKIQVDVSLELLYLLFIKIVEKMFDV